VEAKAIVKHVRISSRKVNIVIDLIRGKKVGDAFAILKHTPKSASAVLEKLLKSAVANAENNHNMNVDKLFISEVYATQGPTLKRFMARAQGRGVSILKRTSHITLAVKEKE
jgi:large subunit ribosomal protein L22